jgi:septal ring factor EnvC (AmiA/AmiB activator)
MTTKHLIDFLKDLPLPSPAPRKPMGAAGSAVPILARDVGRSLDSLGCVVAEWDNESVSWLDALRPATRADIQRLEKQMGTQQSQIDALAAQLAAVQQTETAILADVTTIGTGVTGMETSIASLQAEIATLQAAQPALDLSGITTAVNSLAAQTTSVRTAADAVAANLPTQAPPA